MPLCGDLENAQISLTSTDSYAQNKLEKLQFEETWMKFFVNMEL